MTVTTQDYVGLITGQHQDKPKFKAVIETLTSGFVAINNQAQGLPAKFDLDVAVGQQLDFIGQWIGATRFLVTPLTGVYFTWDDLDSTGWDFGTWKDEFDPDTGISVLPDDAYRSLLKARAVANAWDGTIPEAAKIWNAVFGGNQFVVIQDNQDMTMILGFVGPPLTAIQQALLTGGYIPLKPVGVRVIYYAIPISDGPIFAWDADSPVLQGWDTGSWSQIITP